MYGNNIFNFVELICNKLKIYCLWEWAFSASSFCRIYSLFTQIFCMESGFSQQIQLFNMILLKNKLKCCKRMASTKP